MLSCRTWRKGWGQSISMYCLIYLQDRGFYVIQRNTGVYGPFKVKMFCTCITHHQQTIWWRVVHRIYCRGIILAGAGNTGIRTMRQWSFRVGTLVTSKCREVSLMSVSYKMQTTQCFFSIKWTGALLASSEHPAVTSSPATRSGLCNSRPNTLPQMAQGLFITDPPIR